MSLARVGTGAIRVLACALAAAALPATAAAGHDAPKGPAEKPKRAAIYDQKADARAQVAEATAAARRDHSRVLVMFGFNTCGWCHKLHALLADNPDLRALVRDEYVLVMVDTEAPHAAELVRECKGALAPDEAKKGVGYPFLAVFGPNGKVVTAQRTEPLEEGDHHDPKRVKEFLARWVAPRADARKLHDGALARAAAEDKRVFVHFGAPTCGWCRRLDAFLAREDIAAPLGRDFIDLKIDTDRMEYGAAVFKTYREKDAGGIPWFAVIDAKGTVLATSDGPKGNVGYPALPHEIDHFLAVLHKTARRIEPGEYGRIEKALRDAAERIEAARSR